MEKRRIDTQSHLFLQFWKSCTLLHFKKGWILIHYSFSILGITELNYFLNCIQSRMQERQQLFFSIVNSL